jgi:hypothetical protein
MITLTKENILKADDIKKELVEVPEWGGSVYVKSMNAFERDKFEIAVKDGKLKNWRATVAASSICDENGVLTFTDADILELSKKSAAPMSKIFDVAMKLSRFTDEDIDQIEKN